MVLWDNLSGVAWHQQPCKIQSYINPPFLLSDVQVELQPVILTISACLNALRYTHVIG